MVQQDLGACDKDRNLSPHFPHSCWEIFNALLVIKTTERIYNTENKWNMVKFTHISNYSDLMGFTIFKCGSGYRTNRLIRHYQRIKRFLFRGCSPHFPHRVDSDRILLFVSAPYPQFSKTTKAETWPAIYFRPSPAAYLARRGVISTRHDFSCRQGATPSTAVIR